MSMDASFEVGEIDLSSYGWYRDQHTTVEENWWIRYGRFIEFQLIFTSGAAIASDQVMAQGLPKPAMAGTYTCLGTVAKVTVNHGTYTSDNFGTLRTVTTIPANTRTVLHGVYIAEA